jgi:hypothetical protein
VAGYLYVRTTCFPAPIIRQPDRLIVKVIDHRVRGLFPKWDLSSLPLSERKEVEGINPERADIIIGEP